MTKDPPNPVTVASLLDLLRAEQATEEFWNAAHVKAAGVLSKWVGKKLTKRINAELATAFPEGATLRDGFNGPEILITNQPNREGGFRDSLFVCYHSQANDFRMEHFEAMDICHGTACAERISQRQALMEDCRLLQRIADRINGLRDAWESLTSILEDTEGKAWVERTMFWRMTGLEEKRR